MCCTTHCSQALYHFALFPLLFTLLTDEPRTDLYKNNYHVILLSCPVYLVVPALVYQELTNTRWQCSEHGMWYVGIH